MITINYTYKNKIEENLKVGLLDILILKLISTEEMYGYQIKSEIASRSNNCITLPEGSLYGPLYRMEKKGYIASRKEVVGKKRFRVYYSITLSGQEYLKEAIEVFNSIYDGADKVLN